MSRRPALQLQYAEPKGPTSELQDLLDRALPRLRQARSDLQDVEVKAARGGLPRSVVETVSAFANGDGGLLVLGLDESNDFAPVEIDAAKIAADLASACADELEPPIRAEIDVATVEGRPVVVALVEGLPPERKPCFMRSRGIERGSFLRTHDGDRALSTYEVHVLRSSGGQPVDDLSPVPGATLADLDRDLLARLLLRLRQTRGPVFGAASDAEILRMMRIVADTGEHPAVTLGGLLALGRYPQQFFPQLDVTFVAYPTPTGEPLADGTRFVDNQSIDGPIPLMVSQTLAALRRNMRRRSVMVGLGREDRWEYPEDAVREVIANALTHRDYHPLAHGTQVRVELYPDRLVVTSPGGLYGPVVPDDLLAEPVSSSRNSLLAKLLEDVEIPGTARTVCENRGTGLLVAAAALRRAGIEPPQLVDSMREFRVTIGNHGLLDDEAVAWLGTLDTGSLNDRQRLGLAFIRRHGAVTNQQYRTLTGTDPLTATRELTEMASIGLLEKRSDRRWTRWHLTGAPVTGPQQQALQLDPGAPAVRPQRARAITHPDRRAEIRDLLRDGPRRTSDLTGPLGITRQTVLRWLRRMHEDGEIEPTEPSRNSPTKAWRLRVAPSPSRRQP